MLIQIYGTGCSKCKMLEANVVKALEEGGLDARVEKVTDFMEIAAAGIMSTPAMAINGHVVSSGRVLNTQQALELLKKA